MTKYYETIHNLETNEITKRDFTADEITIAKDSEKINAEKLAEIARKEVLRQAALDKLGLTAEEAAALLA